MAAKSLTVLETIFCREFILDFNAYQAAIRAGYSAKTARSQSYELLRRPQVQAEIKRLLTKRVAELDKDADAVFEDLWNVVFADPRELSEYRRVCCRHCYGVGFRYQRTPAERERAYAAWRDATKKAKDKDQVEPFDEMGGLGFNGTKPPHAGCPECFGEGTGKTFFKDVRDLSPEALSLYEGVKHGKDGIEIKTRSKDHARDLLARHFGIDRKQLELTGKDGGPIEVKHNARDMTDDELLAVLAGSGGAGTSDP